MREPPSGSAKRNLGTSCPLAFVLSTTRNLKRLHWDWHYESAFKHEFNQPFLDLEAICDDLAPVRHSLKELVIQADCTIDDGMAHPWLTVRSSPTKMMNFEFDHLEIPLPFLVTFNPANSIRLQDVVPRTIRRLVINLGLFPHISSDRFGGGGDVDVNEWDDESLFELIEVWMRSWPECYSILSHVTVPLKSMSWDPNYADTVGKEAKLRELLLQHEVEVKIY
ncbi:hypothetical protein KVT40_008977 [Elsinoe batatas]|uniref:Uncharacterized protein n=1 Tax=Elsinoe batatas TaxID=2601811 RepID=A0A8K0PC04_9PEZI|nr:hypothetical protein KVT40_008977 [Elsinoe batatas]